ncbi:MAG: hypothetical protein HY907_13370 [Deltaproteobacteria bacterium]|nr:hypothetical protein [Deltaproteobacteria bacterium]
MSGTRGVDGGVQGSGGYSGAELDASLADAEREEAARSSDAELGVRLVTQLAIEPYAAPVGGRFPTIIGYDDDLVDRGPGSVYERLVMRLGNDNAASNEQRLGEQLVAVFARCDRDEVAAQVERMLNLSPERAVEFADLCGDLAAAGAQMEVFRGVRQDLTALRGEIERLLGDAPAREEFLVRLANLPPDTARAWLAEFGMSGTEAEALLVDLVAARAPTEWTCSDVDTPMMGPHGEMLPRPPEWSRGACGAPRSVSPETDAVFVAQLERAVGWVDEAEAALDSAGVGSSQVNLFRDYAPATDALLELVAPGVEPEGSLLEDGMRRAVAEQESWAGAVRDFQVVVKVFTALATGPLYGVFGAALAAGSIVGEGANHDRIAAQRALGISDEHASEFATYGDAAAHEGVALAISAGVGLATEAGVLTQAGVSAESLTLDLGVRAAGRFMGAVAGEAAAQFYDEIVRP